MPRSKDQSIPYLKIVWSKGSDVIGDCGICCLGTLTGHTYEDVVVAATKVSPNWKGGLWLKEMVLIAKDLGMTLRRRRKYDLETDVGILDLEYRDEKGKRVNHVVVLNAGIVIDSDCTIWDAQAYLNHYKAKAKSLLSPD